MHLVNLYKYLCCATFWHQSTSISRDQSYDISNTLQPFDETTVPVKHDDVCHHPITPNGCLVVHMHRAVGPRILTYVINYERKFVDENDSYSSEEPTKILISTEAFKARHIQFW
jgi:hypothetical protein